MSFLKTLQERGLIQDISDENGLAALPKGTSCYVGFDPSARSLQLGNLVALITLIHMARAGFKPVILFGGATGSIGDPSGKNAERNLLPMEAIEQNLLHQTQQATNIFERVGVSAEFVNNYDWTKEVDVLSFLRDIGKYFTVNYMIAKEVVKTRLNGEGISYTEFSYMLLQAFDFLHLYQSRDVRIQFGGSDQWGNLTAGLELIRKKIQGEAYAFSTPLILDSQGRKFGKSEGGAIWLDPELTSPYRLHQYLLNVEDAKSVEYLKVFTFLSLEEILAIEHEMTERPETRAAQHALADSVCTLVHGEQATLDAKRCAEVLFGGSIEGLSDTQLADIFSEAPSSSIAREALADKTVLDIFVESGLTKSRGEGKKLLSSGGGYLNNQRLQEPGQNVTDLLKEGRSMLVLRSGKKNYHLLKLEN